MSESRLSRYRLERLLGEGSGGEVHLAHDLMFDRKVALKLIDLSSPKIKNEAETRARFLREVRLTAKLSHPNIIVVYDFGDEGETLFLAMEYVSGGTLAQRIAPGSTPLPISERILLAAEVAEAIAHAHEMGVLHRDLKPANILLTADGDAKVTDFGIAKLLVGDVDLTESGAMVGSPAYMSPEQMRGERADTRSDIFAIGVVLFDLLTGRRPFSADSITSLVLKVLNQPTPNVFEFEPDLPPEVGPILAKCLAKERDDRYETARQLAADLRALVPSVSDPAASTSARRLRRVTNVGLSPALEADQPNPLEPTKSTGERAAAQNAPTIRTEPPRRRGPRLASIALAASVVAAVAISVLYATRREPDADDESPQRARRRATPQATPAPTVLPTPAPTPDSAPEPTAEPTPVLQLGRGTPVPATNITLGDGTVIIPPRTSRIETGGKLALRIRPDQARVFLDGRLIGVASDWDGGATGSVLSFRNPGKRRIRLAHAGRRDLLIEVDVRRRGTAETVFVEDELFPGLPSAPPGPPGNIPPPDYKTAGRIRFEVDPPQTLVAVDGNVVGAVSRWTTNDLVLSAIGVHDLTLTAPGRKPVALRILVSPVVEEPRATVRQAR